MPKYMLCLRCILDAMQKNRDSCSCLDHTNYFHQRANFGHSLNTCVSSKIDVSGFLSFILEQNYV